MGKEGAQCLFLDTDSSLLCRSTPRRVFGATVSACALMHEFNLASGKQLTPLQLSNLTMRVFGQPGQLDNFPDQVKMVAKEYNRWCHPIKSEQLVSDLKKHYAGQGIGRSGRKAQRAEGSDSEPEEQGLDQEEPSVLLGPAIK